MNDGHEKPRIEVLIVDDSAFMRAALSRMVSSEQDLAVAGTASSGSDALLKIAALDPDVITLDIEMPGLNGLETLRIIMARFPRPVIMVSAATQKGAETTFHALAAGAFDYVPKRLASTSLEIPHIREDLISKIKAAAKSRNHVSNLNPPKKPSRAAEMPCRKWAHSIPAIVAIGISTGGPKALQEILPSLPRDMPAPILIVQHMPLGFTAPFAKRLNALCAISIREACQSDALEAGVVYIAPSGLQMTVARLAGSRAVICLSNKPENQIHVPSADVLLQSVASTFGADAMGIVMTGMGSDGAQGMSAIHHMGGFTLGQDETTCAVYGMPRVCAEMGILDRVVPLSKIPYEIMQATHYRKTSAS